MNNMKVEFEALPENEGFARVAVAAFLTPLNPTSSAPAEPGYHPFCQLN